MFELRWLEVETEKEIDAPNIFGEGATIQATSKERVLQYRQMNVGIGTGRAIFLADDTPHIWTDWKDVPTQMEEIDG